MKLTMIDVRTSAEDREKVIKIIKAVNKRQGSKYIKPSFSEMGRSYNENIYKH